MKLLIITGSHRKSHATFGVARSFSAKMRARLDLKIEICQLASMKIEGCCATQECITSGKNRCVRNKDDFNTLYDKMTESDLILFVFHK
ncbi:MAG: flavodoxin family protein [bacterium]|nr:flavodoxin family protein [bacterium]